jgi:predicted dehydrogenase
MDRVIRIGVIGIGYWGPNLARNFAEANNAELVAIADLDSGRLHRMKARFPHIHTTKDYREFFTMGVDAVVIATPPKTHYRIAMDCIEHGLHVLVEKPITLDVDDAKKLNAAADERRLCLMTGHTFIYNPAVRTIRDYIQRGELGEVYYIDAVRTNLGLFQLEADVMWDLAPHDISIANYLLGSAPVSVTAQGGSYIMRSYNIHDVVYMHLKYPNDVIANIRLSWLDPNKTRRITIVGSKKMLVYDDIETIEKIRIYDIGVEALPYTDNYGEFQCSYRYGDVAIPRIKWVEPLRMECEHFVTSIINGTRPETDGIAGLHVVQALDAGKRSLISGQSELVDVTPTDTAVSPHAEPVHVLA